MPKSKPVTHVSTNPARPSLTSVIGRELVLTLPPYPLTPLPPTGPQGFIIYHTVWTLSHALIVQLSKLEVYTA